MANSEKYTTKEFLRFFVLHLQMAINLIKVDVPPHCHFNVYVQEPSSNWEGKTVFLTVHDVGSTPQSFIEFVNSSPMTSVKAHSVFLHHEKALKDAFAAELSSVINTHNLSRYLYTYSRRSNICELIGEKLAKTDVLLVTGSRAPHNENVRHMFENMRRDKSTLLVVDEIMDVLIEAPNKMARSLILFCKGLGELSGVETPGIGRLRSASMSMEEADRPTRKFSSPSKETIAEAKDAIKIATVLLKKSLRGSSNYLLALNSFYEFLHQTGHYIFLFTILSGRNFIPFMDSATFQLQSVFGYNAAIFTMIETAVDRFLLVTNEDFHDKICGKTYLFIHTLLSCIPGVYLAARVLFYALDNPTEPVTGQLSDTCTPINLIYNYNMVVCIITFVLYVLLALFVWKNEPQQSDNSTRLVRSLSAICGLLVGSYFFNTIIRMIVVDWLDPIQLWYVNVAGGVLVNIGAAANTPILFITSIPYRTLIKQELRAVWPSRTLATKLFIFVYSFPKSTVSAEDDMYCSALSNCPHFPSVVAVASAVAAT
uniref:ABC transporter domain-containing protein n=1 Tax=Globodera pallida TaxID=36090 RepID=A0A183CIW2_GLOPA